MTSKKSVGSTALEAVDRLVGEVPPTDLIIMTAGFFAGTQGYTPMSAIMKSLDAGAFNTNNKLNDAREKAKARLSGNDLNAANTMISSLQIVDLLGVLNPMNKMVAGYGADELNRRLDTLAVAPGPNEADRKAAAKEYVLSTVALGCVGLIEAYAFTRPGTLAGIGEIVRGIGEIVPL